MFSRAKRQDTGGTDSSELQSSPTSAIRLASSSSALVTSAERRVGSSSSVERKVGSDSQIYKQPHEYAQIKDVAQRIYRKATPILGILDSSEHPVASSLGEDERTEIKDLIKWAHEGLKKRSGDSKEGYSKENKKLKKDYDQIDKRLDQWVEYLKKGEKLPPIDSNFISLYSRGILDFSTPNRGFYDKFTDKMKKNLKYEGSDDLKYEVSDERKLWRARLEIDSMKPEQLEEVLKACAKELNNSFQFSGYYFQDGDTLVYQFNNSIPPDKPRSSEDCKEAFELLSNEMNSLQVKFRSSSIDGPGQLPGDSSDYSVLVPFGKTIGFVEGNKEAEEINTIDIEDSTRANEDDESGRIMRASILSVSWSASTDKPEVYTERVGLIREKNIGAISKICAAGLSYGQELLVFEFHRRGTTVAVATKRENWQK